MTQHEQEQGQFFLKPLKFRFDETYQKKHLTKDTGTQTEEQEQEQEQEQQARGLVYIARYQNNIYIGSTNRELRTRIKRT
jgi:hypothetical protein